MRPEGSPFGSERLSQIRLTQVAIVIKSNLAERTGLPRGRRSATAVESLPMVGILYFESLLFSTSNLSCSSSSQRTYASDRSLFSSSSLSFLATMSALSFL